MPVEMPFDLNAVPGTPLRQCGSRWKQNRTQRSHPMLQRSCYLARLGRNRLIQRTYFLVADLNQTRRQIEGRKFGAGGSAHRIEPKRGTRPSTH